MLLHNRKSGKAEGFSDAELIHTKQTQVALLRDVCILPVSTAFAEGSARSSADFPSVFRMFGSAPCCSSTVQGKQKQYLTSGIHRLFTVKCLLGMMKA